MAEVIGALYLRYPLSEADPMSCCPKSLLPMVVALFLSIQLLAGQGRPPQGIPARSSPADYAAHVQVGGVEYAATLLSADQIKHIFAFDISHAYVVFEVAAYPGAPDQPAPRMDPDGFVVQTSANGDVARAADAITVASVIQQKNLPPERRHSEEVYGSAEVGYESGRDPYTGQRVHSVYTDTRVGVAREVGSGPADYPRPGAYPQDRELLEEQLRLKSFPEGALQHPMAGYLYFPAAAVKKGMDGVYRLQYLGAKQQDDSTSMPLQKVELAIPTKKLR